jgi:hypothetical protein
MARICRRFGIGNGANPKTPNELRTRRRKVRIHSEELVLGDVVKQPLTRR